MPIERAPGIVQRCRLQDHPGSVGSGAEAVIPRPPSGSNRAFTPPAMPGDPGTALPIIPSREDGAPHAFPVSTKVIQDENDDQFK